MLLEVTDFSQFTFKVGYIHILKFDRTLQFFRVQDSSGMLKVIPWVCLYHSQCSFTERKGYLGNLFPLGTYYVGPWGWRERNWNRKWCGKEKGSRGRKIRVWYKIVCEQRWVEGQVQKGLLLYSSLLCSYLKFKRWETIILFYSFFLSNCYAPEPILKARHKKEEEL